MASTFDCLMSTPITVLPAWASTAAVGSPIYPRPITQTVSRGTDGLIKCSWAGWGKGQGGTTYSIETGTTVVGERERDLPEARRCREHQLSKRTGPGEQSRHRLRWWSRGGRRAEGRDPL